MTHDLRHDMREFDNIRAARFALKWAAALVVLAAALVVLAAVAVAVAGGCR